MTARDIEQDFQSYKTTVTDLWNRTYRHVGVVHCLCFLCGEQAGDRYRKALKLLGLRESCPRLYDSISWELSTVCFKMATLLQDFAPVSRIAQQKAGFQFSMSLHVSITSY